MRRGVGWVGCAGVLAICACFGSSHDAPQTQEPPSTTPLPPVVKGDWTYYGARQGLTGDVRDVSADEGGNVYVAGGDAVYAKRLTDEQFLRFDAANAGLTENCNDPPPSGWAYDPTTPFRLCPVISIAGASPGKAIVGLEGLPLQWDSGWERVSGGADVVAFDAEQHTMARTRHVAIATPPHRICYGTGEYWATTCDPTDWWWTSGRRLFRQTYRIAVNHDPSSPMYGDTWVGGNHGTLAVLLANASSRGMVDYTAGWGPEWVDAKDVWEHLHPGIVLSTGQEVLLTEGWTISIDPRNGVPWGSNGTRTVYATGYGADLSGDLTWWMGPSTSNYYLKVWPDDPDGDDMVRSLSHCNDGTLWIGSLTRGLARRATDGTMSYASLPLPAVYGNAVSAVACDPSDASVWVGLVHGGVLRYRGGQFEAVDTAGVPAFASHPVANIQIDRWSSPRAVYVGFGVTRDGTGRVVESAGIAVYRGP